MPPKVRPEGCAAFLKEMNEAHDAFVMTNGFADETDIYKAMNLIFHKARRIMRFAHEVEGPRTAFIRQMLPLWARNNAIQWPEQQLRLPLDLMPSFNFRGEVLARGESENDTSKTGFGVGHTGSSVSPAVIAATSSSASSAEMDTSQGSRKVKNRNPATSSAAQPVTENTSSRATTGRSAIRPLSESPAIRPIRILTLAPSREPSAFPLASAANPSAMLLGPVPASLIFHGTVKARGCPQPEAPSIRKWINSRAMKSFKRASINNLFRQMGRTFREELDVDRSIPIYEHMFGQLKSAAIKTANENCTDACAQRVLYNVMSQFRRHQKELWPANRLFGVEDRGPIGQMDLIVPNVHSQKCPQRAYPQAPAQGVKRISQAHTQQPVYQPVNQLLQDPIQLPIQQSTQQTGRRHTNYLEIVSRRKLVTPSPAVMVAQYLREKYNILPSNVGTPTGHPETSDENPITISVDGEEIKDAEQGSDSDGREHNTVEVLRS